MISALGQCGGPKAASLISITARSEPYSADKAWGQKAFPLGGNQSSTFPRINLTACLTSVFGRLCPDHVSAGQFQSECLSHADELHTQGTVRQGEGSALEVQSVRRGLSTHGKVDSGLDRTLTVACSNRDKS